jgi:curved DNA-binding protein CbpA
MSDPFTTLGIPPDSADDVIRRQYLQLVRTYTPDRSPERFAEIRAAYEKVRDPVQRLRYWLFEAGRDDSIEAICRDAANQLAKRRPTVAELRQWGQRSQ